MEKVVRPDNLFDAFLRAKRGKGGNAEMLHFQQNLEEELDCIAGELLADRYSVGSYFRFTVYDPKKRTICAAPFRDRVAMHALMRVCHPVFDNYQIFDSYASRKQKGTYAAIDRARMFVRKYQWFAKLDVCHFFDSVSHQVLMTQLKSLFKDQLLTGCFQRIIEGYHTLPGQGLPIGNLTSQYFANHYLSSGDHFLKENLHVPAMVRYMDDIILFDNDRHRLLDIISSYVDYVENTLRLQMHDPIVNSCRFGLPFLGYVVFPDKLHLNQRSRKRFLRNLSHLNWLFESESISEIDYHRRLTAAFSFVRHAHATKFQQKALDKMS